MASKKEINKSIAIITNKYIKPSVYGHIVKSLRKETYFIYQYDGKVYDYFKDKDIKNMSLDDFSILYIQFIIDKHLVLNDVIVENIVIFHDLMKDILIRNKKAMNKLYCKRLKLASVCQ